MIFLTVGTQFAFDRLVRAVDQAVSSGIIKNEFFAQIGESEYRPVSFEFSKMLGKQDFDKYISQSSAMVGHAGMGTITAAIETGKPLLVMPRLAKFGEVVNDHQVLIARKFEKMGLLLAAYEADDVARQLANLEAFSPAQRQSDNGQVAARIREFLTSIS